MLALKGLLETTLFVKDLSNASAFYEQVLGLEKVEQSDVGCVFKVTERQLLLLVTHEKARVPSKTPGGEVPPCLVGPREVGGAGHLAFAVAATELREWRARLESKSLEVLSEVAWESGARSLYFRDPDGHLLELTTPGIWNVYW